jgi:hypothetical protein
MVGEGVIQRLIGRQRTARWWLPLLLCALLSTQVAAVSHVHVGLSAADCELCLQGADQLPAVDASTPAPHIEDAAVFWVATAVVLARCVLSSSIRGPPTTF